MKKCSICKETKQIGDFQFIRGYNYYTSICIECEKEKSKKRRRPEGETWMNIICGNDSWMSQYFE